MFEVVVIHSINKDGKIIPFKKMPVSKEKEIEDFIEQNPEILEKELFVIGRQEETSEGKIVDLMGLDKNGNGVIIELKKESTPRKVISQILDYAVWVEELKYEDLNRIYRSYQKATYPNLLKRFQEFDEDFEPESLNQNQKLYVIGEEIDPQTEKLARYLRRNGIEIFCIELNFHELDGHRVVDKRDVVVEDNTPKRKLDAPKTEKDHIAKTELELQNLYDLLKSDILKLGNDISVNPVKYYVGFTRNGKNFLEVRFRTQDLLLSLRVRETFDDPKGLMTPKHKGRENWSKIIAENKYELEDILHLIKQSYNSI